MSQFLKVTVHDRTGVLFTGDAEAVSSRNEKGSFDILSGHEHFISLILNKVEIHLPGEKNPTM